MTLKTLIELQTAAVQYAANNDAFHEAARNFDFAALDRRIGEMEEALRFYADAENMKEVMDDFGERARKVLGE